VWLSYYLNHGVGVVNRFLFFVVGGGDLIWGCVFPVRWGLSLGTYVGEYMCVCVVHARVVVCVCDSLWVLLGSYLDLSLVFSLERLTQPFGYST
jgi:hypothetical protein